jgi:hypothetical protein
MQGATEFSLQASTIILNGYEFTGWSSDTDGLTLPEIELAKTERGADGKMIATATGDKGGSVVFKLLANSPTTKFLQNIIAQKQTYGAIVLFSGTFNFNTGIRTVVSKGVLTKGPAGPTLGKGQTKAHEFTMDFESIISEYLTANF